LNTTVNIKTITPQLFILAILAFILPGCATHNKGMSEVANQLRQNLPVEAAVSKIKALGTESNSSAQYRLNLGYLQLINGDFKSALSNFEQAKRTMKALDAISVTETITASTINETLTSYSGWPTDKVLVHSMMAMAYLLSNDLDGARVEVLQADVQMQKLAKVNSTQGQLAFSRYLAGVVYELNKEFDSALVSYRQAYTILRSRSESIPKPLQHNLVDLTASLGLSQESKKYTKKFNLTPNKRSLKKQFVFSFDGVVTQMSQRKTQLWWDIDDVYLSVALPKFTRNNYIARDTTIINQTSKLKTESIEHIEKRAREDLQSKMVKITSVALARAGLKFQTVKEMNKNDSTLGAFANVLTMLSEVADTRHWGMLPSSIQVATSQSSQRTLNVLTRDGNKSVNISETGNTIILLSSLTNKAHIANY
jgi:hypothetical protein